MSEQQPSLPYADFLKLIDPDDRRELAETAREAVIDHKQMRFMTGWLREYAGCPEVDPDELTYHRRERVDIAKELEIHGDNGRIREILERYEAQYAQGTRHGET
jgi:hypothetical protein